MKNVVENKPIFVYGSVHKKYSIGQNLPYEAAMQVQKVLVQELSEHGYKHDVIRPLQPFKSYSKFLAEAMAEKAVLAIYIRTGQRLCSADVSPFTTIGVSEFDQSLFAAYAKEQLEFWNFAPRIYTKSRQEDYEALKQNCLPISIKVGDTFDVADQLQLEKRIPKFAYAISRAVMRYLNPFYRQAGGANVIEIDEFKRLA